jgi:hypothetical protein
MIGFHCTTPKKLQRYKATGGILPPVRFWIFENSARQWMAKTQRSILLKIDVKEAYPLPDHKPNGHAYWTPEIVHEFLSI